MVLQENCRKIPTTVLRTRSPEIPSANPSMMPPPSVVNSWSKIRLIPFKESMGCPTLLPVQCSIRVEPTNTKSRRSFSALLAILLYNRWASFHLAANNEYSNLGRKERTIWSIHSPVVVDTLGIKWIFALASFASNSLVQIQIAVQKDRQAVNGPISQ